MNTSRYFPTRNLTNTDRTEAMTHDNARRRIRELNECLRAEHAAANTCAHALGMSDLDPSVREQIESLRAKHAARVNELRAEVLSLGGEPEDGFGVWTRFKRLLSIGAPREAFVALVHREGMRPWSNGHGTLAVDTFRRLRELFAGDIAGGALGSLESTLPR
jgi:hypothetical protein